MLRQSANDQENDRSRNLYVYLAIVPVNWIKSNDEEVRYREMEKKQDVPNSIKKTSVAIGLGGLSKVGQALQHLSPNLAISAANLDYASKLQLNQIKPGVGKTGSGDPSDKYEFTTSLPPTNIVRLVSFTTDPKTADKYKDFEGSFIASFNNILDKTSTKIQSEHWADLTDGKEMRYHEIYITTSQPPEYVENHGIDNGLIFYNREEAVRCSKSENFSVPLVEKTLPLSQTFGFVPEDDEESDHVLVDISSVNRGLETLDKLSEKLVREKNSTELMGKLERQLRFKDEILNYLQNELETLKSLNDPQARLKANVAALLIKELNKIDGAELLINASKKTDVSNNNNEEESESQRKARELLEKIQSFAYYKTDIKGQSRSKDDWDNIKKKYSIDVNTYSTNLDYVYANLKAQSEGSLLNSSTFKILDQLTGFDEVSELEKKSSPDSKQEEAKIRTESKPEIKISDRTTSILNEINKLKEILSAKVNKNKDKPNFKAMHKTKFLVALSEEIKKDFINFEKNQEEFIENFIDNYKNKYPPEFAKAVSGATSRVNELLEVLKSGEKPIVNNKSGKVTPEIQKDNNGFKFRPFR